MKCILVLNKVFLGLAQNANFMSNANFNDENWTVRFTDVVPMLDEGFSATVQFLVYDHPDVTGYLVPLNHGNRSVGAFYVPSKQGEENVQT